MKPTVFEITNPYEGLTYREDSVFIKDGKAKRRERRKKQQKVDKRFINAMKKLAESC